MSMFDGLMGKAGNLDLAGLASQVGLSEQELKTGGEALLSKLAGGGHDATSAAVSAATETGIDAGKLQALLPALAGQFGAADADGLVAKLGLTGDGFMGKIGSMLDRDGDGNPVNDLTGMAKGLFGKS